MKKLVVLALCALFTLGAVTSCGKTGSKTDSAKTDSAEKSASKSP